jgi:hypothetical protein
MLRLTSGPSISKVDPNDRFHHRRTTIVAIVVCYGLFAGSACQSDNVSSPPAPEVGAVASTGSPPVSVQARLKARVPSAPGMCIVAASSATGKYRSRTLRVQAAVKSSNAPIAYFAYRGWTAWKSEPEFLAVCSMYDQAGSRAALAAVFRSEAMSAAELKSYAMSLGVLGASDWEPGAAPHVMNGADVFMTDGSAAAFPAAEVFVTTADATMDECDPETVIIECAEEETISPTQPAAEGSPVAYIVDPGPTVLPCTATTDYAHISTTPGFVGRINVHSRINCPQTMPRNHVSNQLRRQKCFLWVFCSWPTIGAGADTRFNTTWADAAANSPCSWEDGWYNGKGYHESTWPTGQIASTITYSVPRRIRCW